MRFCEVWTGHGETSSPHDAIAHEIVSHHITPRETPGRRWYSKVVTGNDGAGIIGQIHSDMESAGWARSRHRLPAHRMDDEVHEYSHPSSDSVMTVRRYVKGDEEDPYGIRTVYRASWSRRGVA